MKRARTSILVTVFNGLPNLREQLDSIDALRPEADEIVIADDRSTDGSLALIQERIAGRTDLRLLSSAVNRGLPENLSSALAACNGDVILLCDQDDSWHPGKVAAFSSALASRPEAYAAFSDARICDAQLKPMGFTLWRVEGCGRLERACALDGRLVRLLAERNVVQGASLGFRSELLPWILPIPAHLHTRLWCHDGWIAAVASAFGPVIPIDRALIDYRIHGGNQVARYTRANALRRFLPRVLRTLARSVMQARAEGIPMAEVRRRDLAHQVLHLETLLARLRSKPASALRPDPDYVALTQRLLASRRARLEAGTGFRAGRSLASKKVYADELAPLTLRLRDNLGF